jgi:hypothetical protein
MKMQCQHPCLENSSEQETLDYRTLKKKKKKKNIQEFLLVHTFKMFISFNLFEMIMLDNGPVFTVNLYIITQTKLNFFFCNVIV